MITIGISKTAFSIGPFSVGWYGLMMALAVAVLVFWVLRQIKRDNLLSQDTVINAALVGVPFGIIFARVFHVVDQWGYYSQHPGEILGGAGLAIWGGVLGTALGIWIFSKVKHFSFGYLADLMAPGIILAQAIGRVGCTFNGCCYGVETHSDFGIMYTNIDTFAGQLGVAYQPTQIYEIAYNLVVFAVLLMLRGRFKPEGSLFFIYLTLYSLWRFGIDFIRDGTPFLFGLHQAQVISLALLAVLVPLLLIRTRPVRPTPVRPA